MISGLLSEITLNEIGYVDSYYIFLFKKEYKADHRQQQQQFNKNQQQ
jgi:hypothetical protein